VALGIVHGQEKLMVTRGVTSVEHPLDVETTTLFQVASRTRVRSANEHGRSALESP
jgi:hypothetical protein